MTEQWYHEIDLGDGRVTPSYMPQCRIQWDNTRNVRDRISYAGKSVLDLGCMDGMWAFEAEKLGANPVVASDFYQGNWDAQKRMLEARSILNSKVMLLSDCNIEQLTERTKNIRQHVGQFDIIQNLGVLYHVLNPMKALLECRRCVSETGTMLLETAVVLYGSDCVLHWNSGFGYDDPYSYWIPTMPCLEAMLEFSGWTVTESRPLEINMVGRVALIAVPKEMPKSTDHL